MCLTFFFGLPFSRDFGATGIVGSTFSSTNIAACSPSNGQGLLVASVCIHLPCVLPNFSATKMTHMLLQLEDNDEISLSDSLVFFYKTAN